MSYPVGPSKISLLPGKMHLICLEASEVTAHLRLPDEERISFCRVSRRFLFLKADQFPWAKSFSIFSNMIRYFSLVDASGRMDAYALQTLRLLLLRPSSAAVLSKLCDIVDRIGLKGGNFEKFGALSKHSNFSNVFLKCQFISSFPKKFDSSRSPRLSALEELREAAADVGVIWCHRS